MTRGALELPVLGLGTWTMGERPEQRAVEIAALKHGLELGVTLIDTAEMYGEGGAERIVAEAIAGCRERVLLVSKVLPQNASRQGTLRACEASLRRLRTDHLDLYLLHWASRFPLAETYAAFEELLAAGKIRHYGVSNLDLAELKAGGWVAANQVLYNLTRRAAEWRLLPWCREHGVTLMAYSPLEQGRLPLRHALQIALAWTIRAPGVTTIPMSRNPRHVEEIVATPAIRLAPEDLAELDAAYPPPRAGAPLETL